ncbi:MAG TPA: hypothetical protein VLG50_07365 [Candidatus Saccharimonadales bacterium]|nr:hypothetical protein [Candidatus Saccharimonadales bacterium]
MKEYKIRLIERVKEILDNKNIYYREFANGHIKVDSTNFWATSEKWFDSEKGIKGVGLNSFIKHIEGE